MASAQADVGDHIRWAAQQCRDEPLEAGCAPGRTRNQGPYGATQVTSS